MDISDSSTEGETLTHSATIESVPVGRNWLRGAWAVIASIFLPGLGHCFLGRYVRGMAFLLLIVCGNAASVVVLINPESSFATLAVCLFLPLLATLVVCIDVARCHLKCRHLALTHIAFRWGVTVSVACAIFSISPGMIVARWVVANHVEAFSLSSSSMTPTLQAGDQFLCYKRASIRRWDLVMYRHEQFGMTGAYVSRVVGLPGETLEILDSVVHINGQPATPPDVIEPYTQASYGPPSGVFSGELFGQPGAGCEGNPITLGDNEYYVLGDNSTQSNDSRYWLIESPGHQRGTLPSDHVVGRVTKIYWPIVRQRVFR